MDDLPFLTSAAQHPQFPAGLPLARHAATRKLESWLSKMCDRMEAGAAWLLSIDLKEGVKCVGQISIVQTSEPMQWALAIWISPEHWRRGLAREAAAASVQFAFTQPSIHRIWAGVASWNKPSQGLIRSLGFRALGPTEVHGDEEILEFALLREDHDATSLRAVPEPAPQDRS